MIFKSLLSIYLRTVRKKLSIGKNSILDPLFKFSNKAVIARKNLEYWLAQDPFISTRRTFAYIDFAFRLKTKGETKLVLRGWVFDFNEKINKLTLILSGTSAQTLVYPLSRSDVSEAFIGEKNSKLCGFEALIPFQFTITENLQVDFSYVTKNGDKIEFSLPLPKIQKLLPGSYEPSSVGMLPIISSKMIIIVDSKVDAWKELVSIALEETKSISNRPTLFLLPGHDKEDVINLSAFENQGVHCIANCSLFTVIHALIDKIDQIDLVIVIHPPSDSTLNLLIPNLLVVSGGPEILWLPEPVDQSEITTNCRNAATFIKKDRLRDTLKEKVLALQ